MIRRSARHRGVYQRCQGDCPDDRCSKHSWSYDVELPGRNGKRQRITKAGFGSAKAAAEARAELLRQHRDGNVADDQKLTVGAWLDRWLRDRERDPDDPIRPTTLTGYRTNVEKYIRPKLGHIRLRDLRRDHISTMLAQIVADREAEIEAANARNEAWFARNPKSRTRPVQPPRPLSRSTVSRIRATMSAALGDAVDRGLLAGNPARQLRLRKGKRRAPDPRPAPKAWSAEDAARFLDATAAEGDPLAVAWHLAALHGLRRAELLGLRWPAVDLDAGLLRVVHTRTATGYAVVEGTGKSEHSRATLAIDPATVELLRAWRTRQARERLALGVAWRGGDHVFVRPDGELWHPDRVSKLFDQAVGRHGLPRISLHGLRHTSASLQIEAGIGIEIVSKRLRHANSTITSAVYSHLVGDAGKQAANAVADAVARHRRTS